MSPPGRWIPPETSVTGGEFPFVRNDQALFGWTGQDAGLGETGPLASPQKSLEVFPPLPPMNYSGGVAFGAIAASLPSIFQDGKDHQSAAEPAALCEVPKKGSGVMSGSSMGELGEVVFQELFGVFPFRSSSTGSGG